MFRNYLKIAWRSIGKNKMHSFINIAGLSLGMAVAILIGLWMHDELSFDRNFRNYDRIAQVVQNVTNNGEVQTWRSVPYPLADELRKNYGGSFSNVVMVADDGDHMLTIGDKKQRSTGGFFENKVPEMFSLHMILGSSSLNDPTTVLISSSAAKSFFGSQDPLDKTFSIDDMPPVKITGVYRDFPHNCTLAGVDFITNWDFFYNSNDGPKTITDPWRPNFTTIYVQLNNAVSFGQASMRIRDAKLKKVNAQLAKKKPELFLQPMSRWHLYSEYKNGVNTGGAIQYVRMFGLIGMFVLLLACINFMNLSTARSEKRAKEVGIRKTVGSVRRQLIFQFFSESLFTTFFAFVLSLLLVLASLSLFNELTDKQMSIPWANGFFWVASGGFILITTLVAGSYPAFYLSSFRPIKVLKGTFKAGRLAALPRKILVVLQFTVSVSLIIGTIVVYKQIQYAKNRPVGYNRNGLVNIHVLDSSAHNHFDAIQHELMQTGVITSLTESQGTTTGLRGSTSGISWKGKDPNLSIDFGTAGISYGYGKTVDWQIKEGREFSKDFGTDTSALILNESAIQFMGLRNPVGENIQWFDKTYHVIGVVQNMLVESPFESTRPIVYFLNDEPAQVLIARLNPSISAHAAISRVETLFKKFSPDYPFEYQFVDDEYAKKFTAEERIGRFAMIFTSLAIVISCLGLFGLASFVAEQRTKEIGIRKVLGASLYNLWNLMTRDFVWLVVISFIVSMPIAWYWMNQWLQDYSYRIHIQWQIFFLAGLLSLLIAVMTVSFQAIRAAISNPVRSLRNE